jgi:VanZ family protein
VKIIKNNLRRERILRYAPLFLWIGVILFLSSGQGSMSQTSRFVRPLIEFLFPNSPEETLIIYHGYIRKLAHFTEYAVLAFWASRAFFTSGKNTLRRVWHLFALLLVLLVALIDETNQSFLDSRTGSIWDVALDFFGGLTATLIFYLVKKQSVNKQRAKEI